MLQRGKVALRWPLVVRVHQVLRVPHHPGDVRVRAHRVEAHVHQGFQVAQVRLHRVAHPLLYLRRASRGAELELNAKLSIKTV